MTQIDNDDGPPLDQALTSVTSVKCVHCGHEWVPRLGLLPQRCPKCQRSNWQSQRTPIASSQLECRVCGHRWTPRSTKMPKVCPKCSNTSWRTGRIRAPRRTKTVSIPATEAATQTANIEEKAHN